MAVFGLEETAELFLARSRGGSGLALFPQSSLKGPSERPERARRVKKCCKRWVQVDQLTPSLSASDVVSRQATQESHLQGLEAL